MRIHLITNLFAPDELAGAALYTDMATYLHERGHDVRVTTTFPYYPAWSLKPSDQGVKQRDEMHGPIPVRRVQMHIPRRVTGASRLLSDFSFLTSLLRRGVYSDWKPEVVVTASPMLSQCIAQRFMYAGQSIPRFIIVQDFVVDAALELGILKLPLVPRLLNGMQNWALRSAETLSTISQLMLEKLESKVGPDRRAVLIPNWIHQSLQGEIDRQLAGAPPRSENTLVYSGNFGVKQGLPQFLDQFRAVAGSGLDWNLEIYGGGAEKAQLAAAITATPSVQLGGVQDEVGYVRTLLRASACLVTQRPGVGANFLPSKLLPALATGTPVLAVCDSSSPLGREISESGCGEVIAPGDSAALVQVLRKWRDNPGHIAEMSRLALKRAALYERNFVLGKYETELKALTERAAPGLPARGTASANEPSRDFPAPPSRLQKAARLATACLILAGLPILSSLPLGAAVSPPGNPADSPLPPAGSLGSPSDAPICSTGLPDSLADQAAPLVIQADAEAVPTNSAAAPANSPAGPTNAAPPDADFPLPPTSSNAMPADSGAVPALEIPGASSGPVAPDDSDKVHIGSPAVDSDFSGAVTPLPAEPASSAVQTDNSSSSSSSAVQDITNNPEAADNMFTTGSPFHFGLTLGETYDDNILISPMKSSDFITHITPSFDFEKGVKTAPHSNYLNLYVAPTVFLYARHSNDNREDYDADLFYQYTWTRLTLALEQRYQHLTDASIDIGSLAPRDIYTTQFSGDYIYNDLLGIYGTATQTISSYQTAGSVSVNEWTIDAYALYQVAPSLSLGAGPRISFLDISGASNENEQDFMLHLSYYPGGKTAVSLAAGGEYLQFQNNTPSHLFPIFEASAYYVPQDGTTLTLSASRETANSFDIDGETILDSTVQATAKQQFLQNFYFTLSGGYTNADYGFGSSMVSGPRRMDDYYFANAGVEWDPKPWLKFNVSYQRSQNMSNFSQDAFNDNQFDVQSSVHF